jgi:hypothetical protein
MSMNFFGDTVTIVNRAPWPVNVRWDGKDVLLQPGETPGFPRLAVPYAKNQNPLMGSEDPNDPTKFQYLVGVKGSKKDNCAPLTDEEVLQHSNSPQRLNRSIMQEERGDSKAREVLRGKKQAPAFQARYDFGMNADDGGVIANSATAD